MSGRERPLPEVAERHTAYRGRLFELRVDRLRWPDGTEAVREIVVHPGAVCIVPVTARGTLLLVEQYRHPAGARLLELPAGTLEPGEDPETAARRELEEEIGMRAAVLEPLGGFYVAPGYTTEYIHLFAASGLEPCSRERDADEDIEVLELTPEEALAAVRSGRITDGKSIIGLLFWRERSGERRLR
jgi:ADP-ribose pyrophosphatase